jgi:hypothetical protein
MTTGSAPDTAGLVETAAAELRRRRRGIAAAIACISVVGFALSLSIPLLSLTLEARGISDTWIGLNTAVSGIAALATAPLVTWAVRRIGTVRLLYIALAAGLVSFLLFPRPRSGPGFRCASCSPPRSRSCSWSRSSGSTPPRRTGGAVS